MFVFTYLHSLVNMTALTYLHYNVIVLKAGGQYKIDKSRGIAWKIVYYFSRVFGNSLSVICLFGLAMDIKEKGPFEFGATALNYGFMFATLSCMLRSIYYDICGDQTENLVLRMNEFFKYETDTGLEEEKSMGHCVDISKRMTICWLMYVEVAILMLALMPLLRKSGPERNLPMPMWLPYDWKTSPYYEITYFLQGYILLTMALFHVATDMFFAFSVFQTAEQFKLIGWELKNLFYTSLISSGVSKKSVLKIREQFNGCAYNGENDLSDFIALCDICKSENFNTCMLMRLNGIIRHHGTLLAFCADMNDLFSPIMLASLFVIMSTALFMNFLLIMMKDGSIVFCIVISSGAYFAILISCFVADLLSTQVKKLQTELYELPWYMCDEKCKFNVNFMLQKMNTPVSLTVGKFADLNLELFLWCIRTVNSYCVLLYQLSEP